MRISPCPARGGGPGEERRRPWGWWPHVHEL
jgi:hypothetical protein